MAIATNHTSSRVINRVRDCLRILLRSRRSATRPGRAQRAPASAGRLDGEIGVLKCETPGNPQSLYCYEMASDQRTTGSLTKGNT
jgi:hypothetical protein